MSPGDNADRADQYYGGEVFFGNIGATKGICMKGGVLGYCGEGLLGSFVSPTAADEFDLDAPPIQVGTAPNGDPILIYPGAGLYFLPAGSATTGPNGEVVVGTGSLAFSDLLWSAANIKNDNVLGLPLDPTQQRWLVNHGEIQAAINGQYLWAANPRFATNQSPSLTAFAPVTVTLEGTPVPQVPWPSLPGWWFTGQ